MIEKHIILEDIDPVMFYGVGNGNLQMIKSLYPVAYRCTHNVIRVLGDEEEMAKAEEDIELMRKHLAKYNMLNEEDILDIVKGKQTKADSVKGVLVYSISGRPIKSRSENQQQLIEAYEKNDMIFAVGPAGTGKDLPQHRPCRESPQGEGNQEDHPLKTCSRSRRKARIPAGRHER